MTSIVRLRQRQDHAEELVEACARLRSIYARFIEGYAYPDLQDAAVLMAPGIEALVGGEGLPAAAKAEVGD